MRCTECRFCTKGSVLLACGLTGCEFSASAVACDLVNDDGTVNYDHPYFQEVNGK